MSGPLPLHTPPLRRRPDDLLCSGIRGLQNAVLNLALPLKALKDGVKKAQATTIVWTRNALIVAYAL